MDTTIRRTQMDTLQCWLNQKGDGAATALAATLTDIGVDPQALVAAIQGEQKTVLLEELARVRKRAEAAGISKDEWRLVGAEADNG